MTTTTTIDLDIPEFLKVENRSTQVPESRKSSWRDVLPIHPAAEMFPLLSDQELDELGADIKANGLKVGIVIYIDPDGRSWLLDGRGRLDAMERVDMPFALSGASLDAMVKCGAARTVRDIDPFALAISFNIHRRHLTGEQKRELIARLLKAEPGRSNNATAKLVKADDKTVASVRMELEARSEIPNVETRKDTKGRSQPASKPRRKSKPEAEPITAEAALRRKAKFSAIGDMPVVGDENPICRTWRLASEAERAEFAMAFGADVCRYVERRAP